VTKQRPELAMKVTKARFKISWHLRVRQHRLPASYYRGGTSRAIIFSAEDLPAPTAPSISHPLWASIFRSCLGSPDPNGRQLDGLGGGISSLSKVCVIGPAKGINKRRADVEYTFAAVGVKDDEVDYSSNCGNMTAAVGPWAWDHGLIMERQEGRGRRGNGEDGTEAVRNLNRIMNNFFNTNIGENAFVQRQTKAWEGHLGQDGTKVVRILNTNTGKIIRSTFEVRHGEAMVDGDMEIAGVAGTGAPIQLDFLDPAGSKTGKLLPTGKVVNTIDGVTASCIDAGNPCVFVRAMDVGADGFILPEEFDRNVSLREKLDRIRRLAGVKMGLARITAEVPGSIPKICMVSKPETHRLLSGVDQLERYEFDLMARAVSVGQPHRAVPITVALCLAVAAKTRGTVVEECLSDTTADEKGITIGHPSGKIVVGAKFNEQGEVQHATLFRTARRLFEGTVFWKVPMDDLYSEYRRSKSGKP
jgi:2-methylaconitate cis-trans-isomerase PrpF